MAARATATGSERIEGQLLHLIWLRSLSHCTQVTSGGDGAMFDFDDLDDLVKARSAVSSGPLD